MDVQPTLISACIKGERRAEYELYKATFSYFMSICIRYTRSEEKAREMLNIGFYKILTHLESFDPSFPFKPWARRIMINTLINEYKKEKAHHENVKYIEEYFDNEEYSAMNDGLGKINAEQIYAFIAKLPAVTQKVFNLYFIDGYKHREIAGMLEMSEGTSKWHLSTARQKLKEMLSNIDQPVNIQ